MIKRWYDEAIEFVAGLTRGQKLLLIICLGFFLRLYVVLNAATIAVDSVDYLRLASEFSKGNFYGGLNIIRPPLYPFLVSLASLATADPELAGRVVSLVFGTLAIWASFYLACYIYNERGGLVTALFVAVHPYLVRYSGDVLTEELYSFLVVMVVLFGARAVFERSHKMMLLASLFSVLAYLTKPGAIGFFLVISLWVAFYNIRAVREDWQRRVSLLLAGWAGFILMALFYLLFLYNEMGAPAVTGRIIGLFEGSDNLVTFLKHFPEAFTVPFFLLFLIYLVKGKLKEFSSKEYYLFSILLSFWLLYLAVNPRRRYFVQLMPIALALSSMGFYRIDKWVRERAKEKAPMIITVVLLVFTAVQLPRCLVSLHLNHLPERLAGQWLLENSGSGASILARKPIIAYYARGSHVPMRRGGLKFVVKKGRERGAEFMAGYTSRLKKDIKYFNDQEGVLLEKVKSFKGEGGREYVIYGFKEAQ